MIKRALFFPVIVAAFIALLVVHSRAQFNGCPAGFCQPIGAAAPSAATTWNPADKSSAFLVLTNSNRTVTYANVGNTNEGIRSIATNSTNQKVYIEHTVASVSTVWIIGYAVSGAVIANGPVVALQSPTLAFGLGTNNGAFRDADSGDDNTVAIPAIAATDRLGIAFNTGTNKVWFRKNGGAWNVTIGGSQDPAAGTGGLTVVLTGSPFFAWVGLDANTGDAFTTNFASTDWVDAAPAGYTQLQ